MKIIKNKLKMSEGKTKEDEKDTGERGEYIPIATKGKEVFKSSFKHWIRTIALCLVVIFVPEQVSWAIGYNPGILWHNLQPTSVTSILQPSLNPPVITNELLAQNLKRALVPLVNRPLNQINFGQDLVLNLGEKAKKISKDKLELAYKWLKDPETEAIHCGIYVLYNLLTAYEKKVSLEQLANTVLLIDILSGTVDDEIYNLKPEVKSSLFALAKAAEYFGLKLYPVKISSLDNLKPPFIAHLYPGHFVLVTKIDEEKVHFFYDKGDTFLPKERFQEDFSGYALTAENSRHLALLLEEESKKIKGAKKRDTSQDRWVTFAGAFAFSMMGLVGMSRAPVNYSFWQGVTEPIVQGMVYRGLKEAGVKDNTVAAIGAAALTSFAYSAFSKTLIPTKTMVQDAAGNVKYQWKFGYARPISAGTTGWKVIGSSVIKSTTITAIQQIAKQNLKEEYKKHWGLEGLVDLVAIGIGYGIGGIYDSAMKLPAAISVYPDNTKPEEGTFRASKDVAGYPVGRPDYVFEVKDFSVNKINGRASALSAFWQGVKIPGVGFYVSEAATALTYEILGNNIKVLGKDFTRNDFAKVKQVYGMAISGINSGFGMLAEKVFRTEASKQFGAGDIVAAFTSGIVKGAVSVGLEKWSANLGYDPFYFTPLIWTASAFIDSGTKALFRNNGSAWDLFKSSYIFNAQNTVENILTMGRGYENMALGVGRDAGYFSQASSFAEDFAIQGVVQGIKSYITSKMHYEAINMLGNAATQIFFAPLSITQFSNDLESGNPIFSNVDSGRGFTRDASLEGPENNNNKEKLLPNQSGDVSFQTTSVEPSALPHIVRIPRAGWRGLFAKNIRVSAWQPIVDVDKDGKIIGYSGLGRTLFRREEAGVEIYFASALGVAAIKRKSTTRRTFHTGDFYGNVLPSPPFSESESNESESKQQSLPPIGEFLTQQGFISSSLLNFNCFKVTEETSVPWYVGGVSRTLFGNIKIKTDAALTPQTEWFSGRDFLVSGHAELPGSQNDFKYTMFWNFDNNTQMRFDSQTGRIILQGGIESAIKFHQPYLRKFSGSNNSFRVTGQLTIDQITLLYSQGNQTPTVIDEKTSVSGNYTYENTTFSFSVEKAKGVIKGVRLDNGFLNFKAEGEVFILPFLSDAKEGQAPEMESFANLRL
ncbi:MAG: cysteine peptidase family C39 domain-containing protein, partial [Candidatus Omnitrophica bacterium]|nr:cysteine peptidase family C39 domain-containing protein [Candidatus Omnitrophota bacterium]